MWYNTIILYYMLQGDTIMLDFTAIDFETANKYYNSACSLAAVSVRDYETVREGYTLIRPPYMSFSPDNIRIHGITPDQVRDKPKFDALWDRVRPHLEGRILVAHYAVFDTRVLRSLLKTYELEPPPGDVRLHGGNFPQGLARPAQPQARHGGRLPGLFLPPPSGPGRRPGLRLHRLRGGETGRRVFHGRTHGGDGPLPEDVIEI